MIIKYLFVLVFTAGILHGQSPMFRVDPAHTGSVAAHGPQNHGAILWKFETGGMVQSTAAIAGKTLYIGSNDSVLYAIDRFTGEQKWRAGTDGRVSGSPAVAENRVYVQASDNAAYALDDASGRPAWVYRTGEDLPFSGYYGTTYDYWVSSPVVVNDRVFFGSGDGYIYALSAETGDLIWRYQTGGRVRSSPAVDNGILYAGSFDGYMYALDTSDGTLLWKFKTAGNEYFETGEIQSSPAMADGKVVFGSRDYNVYALDAATGKELWRAVHENSWVITSPAIADGRVFVGSSDGMFVQALDLSSGKEIWKRKMQANVFASPTVAGSTVYAADWAGIIFAFDTATGRPSPMMLVDSRINSSPVPVDDILYFGCEGGTVYAIAGGVPDEE